MKLDKQTIQHLAKLSRIEFSDEEQLSLLGDLQSILDYVEVLQDIDTENVHPCDHVIPDMVNVMREDTVGETLPQEKFLENAPDRSGDLIRVPSIIRQS